MFDFVKDMFGMDRTYTINVKAMDDFINNVQTRRRDWTEQVEQSRSRMAAAIKHTQSLGSVTENTRAGAAPTDDITAMVADSTKEELAQLQTEELRYNYIDLVSTTDMRNLCLGTSTKAVIDSEVTGTYPIKYYPHNFAVIDIPKQENPLMSFGIPSEITYRGDEVFVEYEAGGPNKDPYMIITYVGKDATAVHVVSPSDGARTSMEILQETCRKHVNIGTKGSKVQPNHDKFVESSNGSTTKKKKTQSQQVAEDLGLGDDAVHLE